MLKPYSKSISRTHAANLHFAFFPQCEKHFGSCKHPDNLTLTLREARSRHRGVHGDVRLVEHQGGTSHFLCLLSGANVKKPRYQREFWDQWVGCNSLLKGNAGVFRPLAGLMERRGSQMPEGRSHLRWYLWYRREAAQLRKDCRRLKLKC